MPIRVTIPASLAVLTVLAAAHAAPAPAAATPPATPPAAPSAPAKIASPAVFPGRVAAKYAKLPAGQARMHSCLDQYTANKATHANGGLAWIQKGGGYYSLCTKKLKG